MSPLSDNARPNSLVDEAKLIWVIDRSRKMKITAMDIKRKMELFVMNAVVLLIFSIML